MIRILHLYVLERIKESDWAAVSRILPLLGVAASIPALNHSFLKAVIASLDERRAILFADPLFAQLVVAKYLLPQSLLSHSNQFVILSFLVSIQLPLEAVSSSDYFNELNLNHGTMSTTPEQEHHLCNVYSSLAVIYYNTTSIDSLNALKARSDHSKTNEPAMEVDGNQDPIEHDGTLRASYSSQRETTVESSMDVDDRSRDTLAHGASTYDDPEPDAADANEPHDNYHAHSDPGSPPFSSSKEAHTYIEPSSPPIDD